ncbi:MAG TPA: hypothetical protein VK138_14165 [Acidiferrobacterales bacterium]|nr:hypothetical protein [Acidiferrobacterales bacterium]
MHTHSLTRRAMLHLIAVLVSAFIAVSAHAAIPATMNYQGILTQSNGSPVNGTVSVVFRLYDVVSGGTALWQESQSVSVSNGNFSVELGTITPLTPAVFVNPVFLGVTVAPDSEMTPRRPLSSVPYAFNAATTNGSPGFQATNNVVYRITNAACRNTVQIGVSPLPDVPTFEPTCKTGVCGFYTFFQGCPDFFGICSLYYSCDGACQAPGAPQQTCANTSIGVIVTPQ